jgi:hypothetical protein
MMPRHPQQSSQQAAQLLHNREDTFMKAAIAFGAILSLLAGTALAQTLKGPVSDKPLDEKWAPTKWGADDSAGSSNHTKNPENIKRALATIKQFKSLTVGKYYHREIPAFGARGWNMTIPGTPTGRPVRQECFDLS